MLTPFLKYWKEGAIAGLVILVLSLFVQWKKSDDELSKAKLAYENPQIKEVFREVKVQGPVRIVYRHTREPMEDEPYSGLLEDAVKETNDKFREIEEKFVWQDTVTTKTEKGSESTPTPFDGIKSARTDRWLVSIGVNKLSYDTNGKALLVGYGFRNRLDVMGGVIHTDHPTGWVFATIRF